MTGLVAYFACVIAISALTCGHHGEDFPPLRWWRARQARTATPREQPATRPRPVPSWAHTEPYDYEEAA